MAPKVPIETKCPMVTKIKWQQKFKHQLSSNGNKDSNNSEVLSVQKERNVIIAGLASNVAFFKIYEPKKT